MKNDYSTISVEEALAEEVYKYLVQLDASMGASEVTKRIKYLALTYPTYTYAQVICVLRMLENAKTSVDN